MLIRFVAANGGRCNEAFADGERAFCEDEDLPTGRNGAPATMTSSATEATSVPDLVRHALARHAIQHCTRNWQRDETNGRVRALPCVICQELAAALGIDVTRPDAQEH